ncbi:MAG: hypothetical protein WCI55_12105 [Armatimonadota bacterium]
MNFEKLDNLRGYIAGSRDLVDFSSQGLPKVPFKDDLRMGNIGDLKVEGMKCPGLGGSILILWFGRDMSIQTIFAIDDLEESEIYRRLGMYQNLDKMVEKLLQHGKMEQSYLLFRSDHEVNDLKYIRRRESLAYQSFCAKARICDESGA